MTRRLWWWLALALLFSVSPVVQGAEQSLTDMVWNARRILFLGDSITAAGPAVANFDAWLLTQKRPRIPEVINAGLPSETVSGLSEEGHAGGQFPRPDLAERLERVLKVAQPDLVIACYGMNCGIYQPFDEGRFAKYQAGIRNLKQRVEQAGAQLVVVTPPFYDDQTSPRPFVYNQVLDRYADWLLAQREQGWRVIDLHHAMTSEVARRRQTDPKFTFQPDGVHPNDAGHWFLATRLIAALGDEAAASAESPQAMVRQAGLPVELLPLVTERMQIRRDAYVSAAGHKRPGVAKGLPIAEAEQAAAKLSDKLQSLRK